MPSRSEQEVEAMGADLDKIHASLLAPWQKINAVSTFLQSRLQFILRGGRVRKAVVTRFDKKMKKYCKEWMHLPLRATPLIVHAPTHEGGAGLLPLADMCDLATVTHGYRLLTCKDPDVKDLAWASLFQTTKQKLGKQEISKDDMVGFLNGETEGEFNRDGGALGNHWTFTRSAGRRLKKSTGTKWRWSEELQEVQMEIPAPESAAGRILVGPGARSQVYRRLATARRQEYRRRLVALPDQGKAMEPVSRNPASSHFLRDGKFTRFAEWRFIHRARLNVVPLNGALRGPARNKMCRRCLHPNETLPHVLNHCGRHSAAWQHRHNSVLHRLAAAIPRDPGVEVRVNRAVPHTGSLLRPDLVVVDEPRKKISIVDVAVPFENRSQALDLVRTTKTTKYQGLADTLTAQGYTVFNEALVVGSLGSWDPCNDYVLQQLRVRWRWRRRLPTRNQSQTRPPQSGVVAVGEDKVVVDQGADQDHNHDVGPGRWSRGARNTVVRAPTIGHSAPHRWGHQPPTVGPPVEGGDLRAPPTKTEVLPERTSAPPLDHRWKGRDA
ncbi:uncharacterized protein LOC134544111, partial [Bacillus rossius redtenbacheri]|uniref:uncharacterized protein LOC134544111 n=1 Tax=Bacillus rossius redtenbacheri TaxID=93214 RepID=UPI002FDD5679